MVGGREPPLWRSASNGGTGPHGRGCERHSIRNPRACPTSNPALFGNSLGTKTWIVADNWHVTIGSAGVPCSAIQAPSSAPTRVHGHERRSAAGVSGEGSPKDRPHVRPPTSTGPDRSYAGNPSAGSSASTTAKRPESPYRFSVRYDVDPVFVHLRLDASVRSGSRSLRRMASIPR